MCQALYKVLTSSYNLAEPYECGNYYYSCFMHSFNTDFLSTGYMPSTTYTNLSRHDPWLREACCVLD